MCGITGFTGDIANRHQALAAMTDAITHRGPDDEGFYEDEAIAMGVRQLNIIDLDASCQPLLSKDGTLVLTLNGRIYNYRDLREELIAAGHTFTTQTDAEVLLHGFEEWQEDVLGRLRGMFAFAIYNKTDKSLFVARDPFGIKPMHYAMCNGHFVYGSEIKSILKYPGYNKIFNRRALDIYLSFQYVVQPETFFEGVRCLLPGHYLWFKDGDILLTRYWEARFNPDPDLSLADAVSQIETTFEGSVEAHRVADVEVDCLLSSGVDSSYVASCASSGKSFTVGFDYGEHYNETRYAESLSKQIGTEQHSKVITSGEYWDAVPEAQYYFDQPLADPAAITLYFASKLASEHVKVVLSGEGADELFGGYPDYREPQSRRRYQQAVPYNVRKGLAKFAQGLPKDMKGRGFLIRGSRTVNDTYAGNGSVVFDKAEKRELLNDKNLSTRPFDVCAAFYDRVNGEDAETKMQYIDISMWLVGDILLRADRMSMAHSLELRVPFLDREVFRVASTLPTNLRVNSENTKYALRMAAHRRLPAVTADRPKVGFCAPMREWLHEKTYYEKVKQAFTSSAAEKFFDTDVLVRYLNEHFERRHDWSRKIWTVYCFLVWYGIYFAD